MAFYRHSLLGRQLCALYHGRGTWQLGLHDQRLFYNVHLTDDWLIVTSA